MQDIAKRLTNHRIKYKSIIDEYQKFINNNIIITDQQILKNFEISQMGVAEIFADLISSFSLNENYDMLKQDLYELFICLEEKFGCGTNVEREKYIAEQLSNAIGRYYR